MKQWKISNYLQVIKGKKKVIIFHSLFGNSFVASKNITLIINFFRKPRTLADLFTKFEIEKNTINELIKIHLL